MQLTRDDEQARAIREARAWLSDPRPQPQIRSLQGAAGTGKTTIAREIADGFRVAFVAPTGKAAGVLRKKGCAGAATIHSMIYRPKEVGPGQPPEFVLRGQDPFDSDDSDPFDGFDGIVADECSMIDDDVWRDLCSFRKKILVIGDPYQLPPVRPSINGPSCIAPTWTLTSVHRQALESGVLRLATDVREGREMSRAPGAYGDDVAVLTFADVDMLSISRELDQVLVGRNATRQVWNEWVREERAKALDHQYAIDPREGDRLVCLRNDHKRGLANGAIWIVSGADRDDRGELLLDVVDEDAGTALGALPTWSQPFRGRADDLNQMDWRARKQRAEFDYAYALTVHKSQGSEWDGVCVFDESACFGAHASKWLYTAITRSARDLVVLA